MAFPPTPWPPDVKNWLIGKDPDAGKGWRQEKGTTEDEMVGWHHWLDGHEFKQAPGVGDGQGSLVLQSMGSQRFGHDWATKLNWTKCLPVYNGAGSRWVFGWRDSNLRVNIILYILLSEPCQLLPIPNLNLQLVWKSKYLDLIFTAFSSPF